ncbi:MAG: hypothetical protein IJ697_06970 [Synergistaceae bacterium]|nr:hypothetical protein [Synergistaceae bacterium]
MEIPSLIELLKELPSVNVIDFQVHQNAVNHNSVDYLSDYPEAVLKAMLDNVINISVSIVLLSERRISI